MEKVSYAYIPLGMKKKIQYLIGDRNTYVCLEGEHLQHAHVIDIQVEGEIPPGMNMSWKNSCYCDIYFEGTPTKKGIYEFVLCYKYETPRNTVSTGLKGLLGKKGVVINHGEGKKAFEMHVEVPNPESIAKIHINKATNFKWDIGRGSTPICGVGISCGELPNGLKLDLDRDSNKCWITGTPTKLGKFIFQVHYGCFGTSRTGDSGEVMYSIEVIKDDGFEWFISDSKYHGKCVYTDDGQVVDEVEWRLKQLL
jgi:hypothetical protein